MAKKNYYAVKKGKVPGIYRTWDECKAQVNGYPGAIFKGFASLAEAEEFLGIAAEKTTESAEQTADGGEKADTAEKKPWEEAARPALDMEDGKKDGAEETTEETTETPWDWNRVRLSDLPCQDPEYAGTGHTAIAYVDGSYQHSLGKFSCGVVLFLEGREQHFAKAYEDASLVSMRNVAGEIKGAELAMAYCLSHKIPELIIYHDYQGIASWCTGEWQAKKPGTIAYRDFYRQISQKVSIRFCKVKGHTGVTYNEKADQLAKQALGL